MTSQKVLVLDIETSPIEAYVWGLKDQNIALNQIKKDWYIMAWAAKWLGAKEVMYRDARKDKDDRNILKEIWNLLNEADIVITQYGTGFDAPRLNTRFLLHGMKPPSPYKHLDTYRIVKRVAQFTSNKLDYLTDKLCTKYKKTHHQKFPGMSLWKECLDGNTEAWDEMKRYNIGDVLSTEELYGVLKGWVSNTAPAVYTNGACTVCGKNKLQKRGYERKQKLLYQRLHCQSCGKWSLGDKINE
jgi:DNA polymerase elongation subunit (family B)